MSRLGRSNGGRVTAALIALALAAVAGFALLAGDDGSAGGETTARPNIVLIVTDDQTMEQFTRRTMPETTRIVADEGTSFSRYWVTTAVCCPSRATMLTGQYAHNHEVLSNPAGYPALVDRENTLPAWLSRAGYTTAHVGKYLNGYGEVDGLGRGPGWDVWRTAFGPMFYDFNVVGTDGEKTRFGFGEEDHFTTVANQIASQQARELGEREEPFYLQIDHRAPHTEGQPESGGRCSGLSIPAPRDEELFADATSPRVPSFDEEDISDKPPFLQGPPLTEGQLDSLDKRWSCALASLKEVDRGVADLERTLGDIGELDDTVIIFTSDNGVFYGQHRIFRGKVLPYADIHHVPLAMRVPARFLSGPAIESVGVPTANIDLAPTILELAGAEPCLSERDCRIMDGRSLLGLIDESDDSWPAERALVFEYEDTAKKRYPVCAYSGVLVGADKLTHHTNAPDESGRCAPQDVYERYDLSRDTYELENMCHPRCPTDQLQTLLEQRLDKLRECAGVKGRDPLSAGGVYCE